MVSVTAIPFANSLYRFSVTKVLRKPSATDCAKVPDPASFFSTAKKILS